MTVAWTNTRTAAAVVATLALTVQGCSVTTNADDPSSVSGTVDDATRWDLTEPPTRAEVGMAEDASVAVYETDAARTVTFLLPQDVELPVEARLVNFVALGASDSASADPRSVDVKTPNVDLDTAYEWFVDGLARIGADPRVAQEWRRAALDPDASGAVTSTQVRRQLGYLTVYGAARYDPEGGTATVSWGLSWR